MPDTLTIREIKARGKVISSTLLDPKEVSKKELADLYVKRWLVEVDFRSIKETLQMDVLRCKTPEMIRKEIGVHLLAYNLIRTGVQYKIVAHSLFWHKGIRGCFSRELYFIQQLINLFYLKRSMQNAF